MVIRYMYYMRHISFVPKFAEIITDFSGVPAVICGKNVATRSKSVISTIEQSSMHIVAHTLTRSLCFYVQ